MNASEAVVCVAGLAAVTGLIIFSQINKKKEKDKFEEEKTLFSSTHKIDEMINAASVKNQKIEEAENKALAKDLMMRAKDELDKANDISSYKSAGDNFLNLYSAFTEGDAEEIKANLLYFKMKEERKEKIRAEELANKMQNNILKLNHQHELDKINAVRRTVESFLPDAYTMGQLYKTAAKTIADKATGKMEEVIEDVVVQPLSE